MGGNYHLIAFIKVAANAVKMSCLAPDPMTISSL